ncbi:MAG TPA: DUF4410 domain-containing protein [Methylomirabilota bacterium]|nr:DUF4410 domain-containing protein [Methylomirabilota bacterium]
MMRSGFFFRPLAFGFFMLFAGCYGAYQVRPDDPVGAGTLKPTVEDKDIGLVGIADGFNLTAYQVVLVDSFPVTDPAIKDEGDRRFAASMTAFLQSELVRRLRESGLFVRVVNLTETEWRPGAERALRLQGKITRLGEGSQAARAFFGAYGAGKARAQAETTFLDVQTSRPVMVTADRRVAQMGFFGGDSRDHLRESFDDMARDLAKFLVRLSKGEAPKKD